MLRFRKVLERPSCFEMLRNNNSDRRGVLRKSRVGFLYKANNGIVIEQELTILTAAEMKQCLRKLKEL